MFKYGILRDVILALILGLSMPLVPAAAPQIQFLTYEFPPFTFMQSGQVTGLASDIMRELQRRVNIHAQPAMVPFARAYMTATTTPNVALFVTVRSPEREKSFQWVGPVANLVANFYAPNGSTVKINSLDDAKRIPVIIVHHGSHAEQALRKLGFTNLRTANTVRDVIRALLLPENRNAVSVMSALAIPDTLSQLGLTADAIQPIYMLDKSQAYIAFSEGTAQSVIADFQKALDDMKRDGSFSATYAKWLPREKPPGIKPDTSLETP